MHYDEMDIRTRGEKAVEGFVPRPYDVVDKRLREATEHAGETLKEELRKMIAEEESYDVA